MLNLIHPEFSSDLCALVYESAQYKSIYSYAQPSNPLLNDLRDLFFICESVASARIEGNHTTVAQYIKAIQDDVNQVVTKEPFKEISNIIVALTQIHNTQFDVITQSDIRNLHRLAVGNLDAYNGEGDFTPGSYRKVSVRISKSDHTPPDASDVPSLVQELVDQLNVPIPPQYELLRIALAHWKFVWIHPFANGNGRTARLLTYLLLVKGKFIRPNLLLNPNALFCVRRNEYYQMLAETDDAYKNGRQLDKWCLFMLSGLKDELASSIRLSDPDYIVNEVVAPSLYSAREYDRLTTPELKVALFVLNNPSSKISDAISHHSESHIKDVRHAWTTLREKNLIIPVRSRSRVFRFSAGLYLYQFIARRLYELGILQPSID